MINRFRRRHWQRPSGLHIVYGLLLAVLAGCGPSVEEIAQREEAERRAELSRIAVEQARQAQIAARQAELARIEQSADQAAHAGDAATALSGYKELLRAAQGNGAEDLRLREKIIGYVHTLNTPPPITEEVRRQIIRAQTILKINRDPGQAVAELDSAMLLAPWWADGYYNLGLMQEGAGQYGDAIRSLKLCLRADPHAPNIDAIQNKIYELEVQKENADRTRAMAGTWTNNQSGSTYTVTMVGNSFQAINQNNFILRGTKDGMTIKGTVTVPATAPWKGITNCMTPEYTVPLTGQIAPDGSAITFKYMWNNYLPNFWNITLNGLFAVNNTGHNQGDCISVTLQSTSPDEFTLVHR
ncbi:MAG: tetratricopeptide repeat protein [Oryzomonas sp.]|jgi:tetratricopeptide (TPR) repeat protein